MERTLFDDTSRRIFRNNLTKSQRSALKSWRQNHLFEPESNLIMRLQDKGNRFVIVNKATDTQKAKEKIERSSFAEINYDPTTSHVQKVENWARKWHDRGEISKEWKEYVINKEARPGKNPTLYKTHKQGNRVRLLTSGCNTAIENLARFIESICAPLTEELESRIRNTSHLLDIIDQINRECLPSNLTLVSFDIVNMFPSINNKNGIEAVTHKSIKQSNRTEPIIRVHNRSIRDLFVQ